LRGGGHQPGHGAASHTPHGDLARWYTACSVSPSAQPWLGRRPKAIFDVVVDFGFLAADEVWSSGWGKRRARRRPLQGHPFDPDTL
jgi:hypothetical protein